MPTAQQQVFTLRLTYCAPCGYTQRALNLATEILAERKLEYFIKHFDLVPGDGGRFEFEVNGDLLFSKKQEGRHAEPGEIKHLLAEVVSEYMAENNIILAE
jgi:selenoprotein W-related protein